MFKNIPGWVKSGAFAVVLLLFIVGAIAWADRPMNTPDSGILDQQTRADNAEIDYLTKQILSGSLIWKEMKAAEDLAHAERVRQEQGNAGYRHTLCTKFQKILTESGTLIDAQLSTDGSMCMAMQGF